MRRSFKFAYAAFLAVQLFVASLPSSAVAGCGCDKPPPPLSAVRPNVTWAGMPVSLFSPAFTVGTAYTVTFTSGITGESASVAATVVSLRDLADGYYKPQLVVALPVMPLGPTTIRALRNGATVPDVSVADNNFTVAPTPVSVPYRYGWWQYPGSQAAVDRNGTLYLSLDLTGVTTPLIFDAQMLGYPLRFGSANVVFRNTQGFLMQSLLNSRLQPVPGMFVMNPASTADSNILRYSRHEFSTYFLQHMELQPHQVDPTDGNWHIDGTRHVDHYHLIMAISGKVNGIAPPPPGATPAFNMLCKAYSLFNLGLVGTSSMTLSGGVVTDSFDSNTMLPGSHGDVYTLGTLTVKASTVNGDATAKAFSLTSATITGTKRYASATTFLQIIVPTGIPSLGSIYSITPTTQTIRGPGSFLVSSIALSGGAKLFIDNTAGPVTLYVSGAVTLKTGASIQTADPKPEKFAMYVSGTSSVTLNTTGTFSGTVYAPTSAIYLYSGNFSGAFFGKTLTVGTLARVHYDSSLSGSF